MTGVLLSSLLFLLSLAGLCFLLVKMNGKTLPSLKSLPSVFSRKPEAGKPSIVIRQRTFLGWKSSAIDIDWEGTRYLVVLQEGRCTVVGTRPVQQTDGPSA